ncbi:predicted protein [Pyrenophora tritici-repentis Pt-1C-BFP]|uniref:Uncharacterized protein n=1 Tax=Pyrenophora tritici-repentis (strain Pt-1C-BFP) TaxID=426418 RepID=B2WGE7_PYRTR|nr:uncharacterized protein PTRG_09003 [Pyrenophora tritici-repentis Pt-1C-BFP]EDU42054.1 predicted protein [Pyrenophora tritici-repentis Pt-1C-BFP]
MAARAAALHKFSVHKGPRRRTRLQNGHARAMACFLFVFFLICLSEEIGPAVVSTSRKRHSFNISKRKSNICPATSFSYCRARVPIARVRLTPSMPPPCQTALSTQLRMIGSIKDASISHDDSRHPTCVDRYASPNLAWWGRKGKRKRKVNGTKTARQTPSMAAHTSISNS